EAEAGHFRCDSLKLCCLSAEPAYPHIVATVERAFGGPAVAEYGATECPLIASEGPDRTFRIREDMVLVDTRPPPDRRHEVLMTVLANPSFPLLRYAIGDVTDAPLEYPERGFAVMKNVAGRENEIVVTGTGRFLHPVRFDFLFGFGWAESVRRYQI